MGGDGIGQLHGTATGGTGSVDTDMKETEAGGGGGSAAGQQIPAVAAASGEMDVDEDEQARRAAEAAQVASGISQTKIWVTGALMVRGTMAQAQKLVRFLRVDAEWLEQRGDSYRGKFQLYQLSTHLEEAAAARAAGGWLKAPDGGLYRFDVAGKGRDKLAATDAPVRPPAEPRLPGAPGCRPATSAWQNPLCPAPRPAHTSATDLSAITAAVSKEVTAEVKRLLEHHREQEKALLQATLQAAQQALQQAAERAAEHKVETEQLKMELAEMKVKLATLKQRPGATPPGEPQPPPAWQSNSEVQPNRQEKLLSALVEQLRGGVVEGRATQLELVGKLGNVAGKLDEVTTRLSFLEQQRRPKIGGPSRSLSSSRVSQRGQSPTFSAAGAGAGIFAQPPEWPPPGSTTSVEWSKLTGTSPFLFGHPATGAVRVATDTVPFEQRVPETLPVPRSTGGKEEEESEGVCHFSEYESHGAGSPAESEEDGTDSEEEPDSEEVLEVTPKLDSGSTTPAKPRSVPAPNVRACSKSSPRRTKSKRPKSPGDTPGRAVVVRQNATDLMDEEVQRWAVAAAEPKKELFY